ncbi:aminotransferase class III-fold pyridoxal phosphate-dependent enzyme [Streptomyces sp. NPDC097619]|uniref:aminotransferase class III-fold pyridoxal phosphate-dependent enzyme n=1 Tax=Streptomyces sp. NPDC097619 TaxID=3157228 RepID=UPI003329A1CC
MVPVRARGLTIEAADGRRYLDCLSGAGTLALGHNHPVVLEAIRRVIDSGAPLDALGLDTPVREAFTAELLACLPAPLARDGRIRFCGPAGADAVAEAVALARRASGRPDLIVHGAPAYPGAGDGPPVTGPDGPARAQGPRAGEPTGGRTLRLPHPREVRCAFGTGGPRGAGLAARWTEEVLDGRAGPATAPAAVLLEPVRCEAGVHPAPDPWTRRLRELTRARGIALIADETRTGVGRTGAFWGVDHAGVVPDVMVLSRALGGSLPLSVVVHHADLDPGPETGAPAGFPGNQLAMAAGTATLAHVRTHRLAERAAALGARMLEEIRGLAARHTCVGEVRGRGLMIGLEIVDPERAAGEPEHPTTAGTPAVPRPAAPGDRPARTVPQSPPDRAHVSDRARDAGPARPPWPFTAPGPAPSRRIAPAAPALAAEIRSACLDRGLILGLGGPHGEVVRLLPPLTLTDGQADAVLERLADAVAAAERNRLHRPRTPR